MTDVSEVQDRNAESPMEVTLDGSATDVSELQEENADHHVGHARRQRTDVSEVQDRTLCRRWRSRSTVT